ncbi:MAG: hypothetical protein IT577_08430, partial [Verrucomicrobiae bacterium]|nr:hypothetical protein [Verrucomicrobiae bacterium]
MAAILTARAAPAVMPSQATLAETQPSIEPPLDLEAWRNMPLGVLATELSPATLLSAQTHELGLFRNMAAWGQGAPSHLAIVTDQGVKVFPAGATVDATMSEAWLLAWFADAKGWERWDAPVLIVLEHKPTAIHLDAQGLTLNFGDKSAGLTAVMPLWGYDKIALSSDEDFRKQHDLPSRGLYTRQWSESLPDEVTKRCRYFASVLRQFPVHLRETFALDGDALVVRSKLTWLTIDDDWKTPAIKLAPLPPTLGLAWWSGRHVADKPFPMRISDSITDPDMMTSYGPWLGVEGKDEYEVRFDVLQYVRQTVDTPDIAKLEANPLTRPVLDLLRQQMAKKFQGARWEEIWDYEVERSYGGPGLYCWQVMGDRWYGPAERFVGPETRRKMRDVIDAYLRNWVLDESKYTPFRGMLLFVGPGIATWGGSDDAGKFSTNLLDTLWHLAYYGDEWPALEGKWPMLKRFFITPLECDWKGVGRHSIAEMGDEAAPPIAYARLAWHFGDVDQYAWGCYIFARELVHHYVKEVGSEYFRQHQPYQSMEPMRGKVWLTNLWGDVIGWQIDGPVDPEQTGERQSNNRWVRFSSFDVARFYHDVLPKEVRAELDDLTERARQAGDQDVFYKIHSEAAHIAPSLVRLRAMLTDDTPEDLLT